MSLTYYAVTNDPNELAHFGIKGMKWGVRRTDAQLGHPRHTGSGGSRSKKPRSAAYKKAQSKLSAAMKNGIKAVETKWKVYNSPVNKQIRAAKRYESQTNRAIQKARKGKLKYGKLTDDQVYRITERLALERNARSLSNEEKTFGKRLRESISQGVISGIGSGVSRMVSENIGRKSELKTDRMRIEQQNELNRRNERKKEKHANSRRVLRDKANAEADLEYYKTRNEEVGEGFITRNLTQRLPGARVRRREYVKNQKEVREFKDNQKEQERANRQTEASMAREIAKSINDRAWNAYQAKLNAYNTDIKEWRKNGSAGPKPRMPSMPKINVEQYYLDYDDIRRRRRLTP